MFENRRQAGSLLAEKLQKYKGRRDALVLAVPRGGVLVGKKISIKLGLPLGIVVVKKIGALEQPELAIGAVGPEGEIVLDKKLIKELGVEKGYLKQAIKDRGLEVSERISKFRQGGEPQNLQGKIVILVDDGIATGATIEVAIKYLRKKKVEKIILAVPVAPRDTIKKLKELVDEVVILEVPAGFFAVGEFYRDFPQVTDEEVIQLLR